MIVTFVLAATLSGELDPCALVTKSEAAEALGTPVRNGERPPEAKKAPNLSVCRYVAQRGPRTLRVVLFTWDAESEARDAFQSAKEHFPDEEAVTDVGEDAFRLGDQLHALQGKVYLIIEADVEAERATQLARTAARRIREHGSPSQNE